MPQLTAMQVFEFVSNHLLKQNRQSLGLLSGYIATCFYRSEGGCKCAIGCLIPDDKYTPSFEGIAYNGNYDNSYQERYRLNLRAAVESVIGTGHDALLHSLQTIHDRHLPTYWPEMLDTLKRDIISNGFDSLEGNRG